jgi:hypothetical protein
MFQRIESWWGHLQKNGATWWSGYFKDIRSKGLFDGSNLLHVDCIRYCFMPIIQKEFEQIAVEWNNHRIRKSHNAEAPAGIPDILYYAPEGEGVARHRVHVSAEQLEAASTNTKKKPPPAPPEFSELADHVMKKKGWEQPTTAKQATDVYEELLKVLEPLASGHSRV